MYTNNQHYRLLLSIIYNYLAEIPDFFNENIDCLIKNYNYIADLYV